MNIPEVVQAVVEVAGSEGASTTIGISFVRRETALATSHNTITALVVRNSCFDLR